MSLAKRSLRIISSVLVVVMIVAAVWLWLHRQFVQDWFVVRSFTPTTEIASIADRAQMNERGTFLFYASEPVLSEAAAFNVQCHRREATSAILGCYTDGRIYLYQIKSAELDGIREVTAAHEMLHAAWERMSEAERERITAQLEAVYSRIKTAELDERMGYYQRQQPGQRANELHSIIGTEIADVGDVLEQHYRTYFTNRKAVVTLHDGYAAIFAQLEKDARVLKAELEREAPALNAAIAAHNDAIRQLNSDVEAHNQAASSVDRTDARSVNAYNARRSGLLSRQQALDAERLALDARRQSYDDKVTQYNELVIRSESLTNTIDSMATPHKVTE